VFDLWLILIFYIAGNFENEVIVKLGVFIGFPNVNPSWEMINENPG